MSTKNLQTIEQSVTVRITSHGAVGTGVILPVTPAGLRCIVTAKHVMTGKQFNLPPARITIDKIIDGSNQFQSVTLNSDAYKFLPHENEDICLLLIDKNALPENTLLTSQVQCIKENFNLENCSVRGFASAEDNKESVPVKAIYQEQKPGSPYQFRLKAQQTLSSFFADGGENAEGLSGGGVFFHFGDNVYLHGVVESYANPDGFHCVSISAINELLSSADHGNLPYATLITDAKVVRSLTSLQKNETLISARIKDNIGGYHIEREQVATLTADLLENRCLVLRGDPGAGKSAMAKEVAHQVCAQLDAQLIVLSGEQISKAAIGEVLDAVQVPMSMEEILDYPLAKTNKLIWIDGIEKILETDETGAFSDLLNLIKDRPEVKLLATIRNYAHHQFLFHFQALLGNGDISRPVQPLTTKEMEALAGRFPALVGLLANPKLRPLLQLPFYLNYAIKSLTALAATPHLSIREFKAILWKDVIEAGDRQNGQYFEHLCVKRAKEMALFTRMDIPANVLQHLQKEQLITIENDMLGERFSPAHDVLEDWALIRFIKRHFTDQEGHRAFFAAIGNEPSMRRAFRLWLSEELESAPESVSRLVDAVIADTTLEPYWAAETQIAVLRSAYCNDFFMANKESLLANKGARVIQLINLLVTTCIEPSGADHNTSMPQIIGQGWSSVIHFLHDNPTIALDNPKPVLIFLIRWSDKLFQENKMVFPEESRHAGLVLLSVLQKIKSAYDETNRQNDKLIEKGIKVVFLLTEVIVQEVESLIRESIDGVKRKADTLDFRSIAFYEQVQKIAFDAEYNISLCAQLPDVMIELIRSVIHHEEEASRYSNRYGPEDEDPKNAFGIQLPYHLRIYKPSALQTPFYRLLTFHPDKGLALITALLNEAMQCYDRQEGNYFEPLTTTTLELNDGIVISQYGNATCWCMYRTWGARAPEFLQSMLMALEKYLMDLAGEPTEENKALLLQHFDYLYKNSFCVATTAVLFSVAQLYPEVVGDAWLPILTSKEMVLWENERMLNDMLPDPFGQNDKFSEERRQSDSLPHRRRFYRISNFIAHTTLQQEGLRERIGQILAEHRKKVEKTTNVHWIKILDDADINAYKLAIDQTKNKVTLEASYSPRVQEYLDSGKEKEAASSRDILYHGRIKNAYQQAKGYTPDVGSWREIKRAITSAPQTEFDFASPVQLAIVGIRDHLEQLNIREKSWCFNTILVFIEELLTERSSVRRGPMSRLVTMPQDVQPALTFLPLLLNYFPEPAKQRRIKKNIFAALSGDLHDHEHIHLLQSVRDLPPALAFFRLQCIDYLTRMAEKIHLVDKIDFWERDKRIAARQYAERQVMTPVLKSAEISLPSRDMTLTGSNSRYLLDAFAIIPTGTQDSSLRAYCFGLTKSYIESLGDDIRSSRRSDTIDDNGRIAQILPGMLLLAPLSFAQSVVEYLFHAFDPSGKMHYGRIPYPKQEAVHKIFAGILAWTEAYEGLFEETQVTERFWTLWKQLHLLNVANNSYRYGDILLLDTSAHSGTYWKPLVGQAGFLKELIFRYGKINIPAVIKLLANIGFETLMPQGISWLVEINGRSTLLTMGLNSRYGLLLIQRAFTFSGMAIKQNRQLTADFIQVLDRMISINITDAYLIREEMITFKARAANISANNSR